MTIDLDILSIEELVRLREAATERLNQKVAARRAELEAELKTLSQYNAPAKKHAAKKKKGATPPIAEAA